VVCLSGVQSAKYCLEWPQGKKGGGILPRGGPPGFLGGKISFVGGERISHNNTENGASIQKKKRKKPRKIFTPSQKKWMAKQFRWEKQQRKKDIPQVSDSSVKKKLPQGKKCTITDKTEKKVKRTWETPPHPTRKSYTQNRAPNNTPKKT